MSLCSAKSLVAAVATGVASTLASGCDRGAATTARTFSVSRIVPALEQRDGSLAELYLNQEIAIRFSRPVDRLSITRQTVVVTDSQGQRVPGDRRITAQTVTFVPHSPLTATLDDGSFHPGQEYRIEVAGFPRPNAVRSAAGEVLAGTVVRRFRAVGLSAEPSPLLRSDPSPFGFALDSGFLGMAAGSRVLRLYFHEQPLPSTVTPEAFRLYSASDSGEYVVRKPTRTRLKVVSRPAAARLPKWLVALEFATPPAAEPQFVGMELVDDPATMLRDVTGKPPQMLTISDDGAVELAPLAGEKFTVEVFPDDRVPLLRETFSGNVAFQARRPGAVGFEVRGGKAQAQVRVAGGTGRLGVFAPQASIVLEPGVPFDRGDGVMVSSDGPRFDFLGVYIPSGVTVSVRSPGGERVEIRTVGSVRIEGVLELVDTPSQSGFEPAANVPVAALTAAAGTAGISGGDILVFGQIRHRWTSPVPSVGSSLALIAGGVLWVSGGVPPQTILASEPETPLAGVLHADALQATVVGMQRDLPPGVEVMAEAVTGWLPLRPSVDGTVEVLAIGASPGLHVEVQLASSDPSDPGRPNPREPLLVPVSVPTSAQLHVPSNGLVRFFLSGKVVSGQPLPSLDGVVVRANED